MLAGFTALRDVCSEADGVVGLATAVPTAVPLQWLISRLQLFFRLPMADLAKKKARKESRGTLDHFVKVSAPENDALMT